MARKNDKKGLKMERRYTQEGKTPYELFDYELR